MLALFLFALHAQTFDAHVHLAPGVRDESVVARQLRTFLDTSIARHHLLISPAYLDDKSEGPAFLRAPHWRDVDNALTARMVARFADRVRGLCGISLEWPDLRDVARRCLARPGMVGVKIRDESVATTTGRDRLRGVLALEGVRVLLIHLYGDYPWAVGNPDHASYDGPALRKEAMAEIDVLLQAARERPGTQIVFAHSLNSSDLTNQVARSGLRNVWIDTSTALTLGTFTPDRQIPAAERPSLRAFVDAWRRLGFDRVLFGSDQFLGGEENLQSPEAAAWRDLPGLTPAEREKRLAAEDEMWNRLTATSKSPAKPPRAESR